MSCLSNLLALCSAAEWATRAGVLQRPPDEQVGRAGLREPLLRFLLSCCMDGERPPSVVILSDLEAVRG